jgi:hypothetical protein
VALEQRLKALGDVSYKGYLLDFIAEKLKANSKRFVRRMQFNDIAANAERASLEIEIVAGILDIARGRLGEFGERVMYMHDNFSNLGTYMQRDDVDLNYVLYDFGISSYHLERSGRGFAFSADEFLDMRLDAGQKMRAYDVVNTYGEKRLSDIIFHYGEERWARRIAAGICATALRNRSTSSRVRPLTAVAITPPPSVVEGSRIASGRTARAADRPGAAGSALQGTDAAPTRRSPARPRAALRPWGPGSGDSAPEVWIVMLAWVLAGVTMSTLSSRASRLLAMLGVVASTAIMWAGYVLIARAFDDAGSPWTGFDTQVALGASLILGLLVCLLGPPMRAEDHRNTWAVPWSPILVMMSPALIPETSEVLSGMTSETKTPFWPLKLKWAAKEGVSSWTRIPYRSKYVKNEADHHHRRNILKLRTRFFKKPKYHEKSEQCINSDGDIYC